MRQFLFKLSYTVFPVFLVLFGLVAYVTLYISPRLSGDLGNLAYIPFNIQGDGNEQDVVLFRDVNTIDELKSVSADVLTIGDSFAQQGDIGFQNFLSKQGYNVVNCARKMYDSPLQFAYNIIDDGSIDSTNVGVIVVEIGERDVATRFENFSFGKVEQPTPSTGKKKSNNWSLLRARDFVMYRYAGRSPVYTVNLNQDYFESAEPRKLYFYCADILNGVSLEENVGAKIKQTFNLLQKKGKEKGLEIILMVPVDKYDLYQNYIVANPYPQKTINEDLEDLFGNNDNILICKNYLVPLLERGEKDVFLIDDSHWSAKASKVVAGELGRRMRLLDN